jgi:hypothetical protein
MIGEPNRFQNMAKIGVVYYSKSWRYDIIIPNTGTIESFRISFT